jgi:glycerophosphoryl diester phosphodiesterase
MNTIKITAENKPLMVAHRGCSGLERENTNAAFVAAGNRSYWGIETDVHKTLDGKYIIIHDDDTARVAVDKLVVEESTFDTLRKLTLRNKATHEKDRSDLVLPSLAEYIGICKYYEKEAVLELKNAFEEQDIYEICDIIEGLGYLEHTTFISFDYNNLVYLRRKHPTASAQFLIGKTVPENWLAMLKEQNVDLDIYHKVLTREMVEACHANGFKVNVWTVDKPEDAERVIDFGVDMITSNILE